MRVSHIAVLAAVLAIPSVAAAQQDGPVGGRVGSDLEHHADPARPFRRKGALWRSHCHRPSRWLYGRGDARAGRAG